MAQGLDFDLKCFTHNESFETPKEFDNHCNEKPHPHPFSETLCSDCLVRGIKVRVKVDEKESVKGRIPQARCEKCEDAVFKKIKERKERKND